MKGVGFLMLIAAAAFGVAAIWTGTAQGSGPWVGRLGGTGGVLFLVGAVLVRAGKDKAGVVG